MSTRRFAVEAVADGESALHAFQRERPDLVLLDLMLRQIDGYEVFQRMRDGDAPAVIMLTAKGAEIDRIAGLELGADDDVAKPFSPGEVVARVRAVLRRVAKATAAGSERLVFADVQIDVQRRQVRRGGAPVHLSRKEFDLLHLLASHPGQVSRDCRSPAGVGLRLGRRLMHPSRCTSAGCARKSNPTRHGRATS